MSKTKYNLLTIAICLIFFHFFSCGVMEEVNPALPTEPTPTETTIPLPTAEGMQAVNLTTGYREDRIILSDGNQALSFKISVPELEAGEKVPLIIALHWSGDNQTYKEFMDCLVQPALSQTKAIIVGPSEGTSVWWSLNNEARLITFINLAKAHWPVENNKVAMLGYSNGGTSSWYFAAQHPTLFSAAIPMAGSYSRVDKIDIPTYIIHGENDELFSHSTSQQIIKQVSDNGSDITFITATGLSHYQACSYTNYLRDAGFWLTNEVWK